MRLAHYQQTIWPRANALVKDGDLVLRLGSDITSEMIRQLNQQDASFSHCGIASIEEDTVFIYHAIGGEFNPDQRLKRETLYSFCHPADNKAMAVYRPRISDEQRHLVLLLARQYYHAGVPFDMSFDYESEERLYCAEFVAKCYSRAMADSSWFKFTTAGTFRYVSVDNLFATFQYTFTRFCPLFI
jgi:Permuted papain-like amidase enzyme, YaeF/YiiX, C92 family